MKPTGLTFRGVPIFEAEDGDLPPGVDMMWSNKETTMVIESDQHPDILAEVTGELPAANVRPPGSPAPRADFRLGAAITPPPAGVRYELEVGDQVARAHPAAAPLILDEDAVLPAGPAVTDPAPDGVAVDVEFRLSKVAEALTGYATAAVDRVMLGLALDRWEYAVKVRLRPNPEPFGAGHIRVDVRLVATRREISTAAAADPADDPMMTEEHHSVIKVAGIADAKILAGTFQAAVSELAEIVAKPMAARLRKEGVLEHGQGHSCAGAMCVGCGGLLCPRTIERRASCDHSLSRGALRCTSCGSAMGLALELLK